MSQEKDKKITICLETSQQQLHRKMVGEEKWFPFSWVYFIVRTVKALKLSSSYFIDVSWK